MKYITFLFLLAFAVPSWAEAYDCMMLTEEGHSKEKFTLSRDNDEFSYQFTLFGKEYRIPLAIDGESDDEVRLYNEEESGIMALDKRDGAFIVIGIDRQESGSILQAYDVEIEIGNCRLFPDLLSSRDGVEQLQQALPPGVAPGGKYYDDPITGNPMYQPPMPTAAPGQYIAQVMPRPIDLTTGEPQDTSIGGGFGGAIDSPIKFMPPQAGGIASPSP
jgi:hypothetical protein